MNNKLFIWVGGLFAKHPLSFSLVLAFCIRSLAAYSNYGPFAVDDYLNVIDPAFRHLILGAKPDIPALRFEVLPYAFSWFMKPLYFFGVKRADLLVSFAYFIMGIISLTQIVAMHRIGSLLLTEKWRNAMTLFTATWAIAPIFTNTADIAGPAYILLTFALLHLVRAMPQSFGIELVRANKDMLLAGLYLSAAIFFRFSLAPLYFFLAVWIFLAAGKNTRFRNLLLFAAGGAITATFMVAIEFLNHKMPFSTAIEFIKYNFGAHIETQSYGSMPWYMYILILINFPLPILAFFFWRPMFDAARRFTGLSVLLAAFLISHSAIAFKLERYVIPVLPIFVIYLFAGLNAYEGRKWVRIPYYILIAVNALCVLPVALTMQQRAGVDGAIYAGALDGPRFAHRIDPWRWGYYGLKRMAPIFTTKTSEIASQALAQKFAGFHVFRFLYFTADEIKELETAGFSCKLRKIFKPDFLERVSIRLNPLMNMRRNDTAVYKCTQLASPTGQIQ